MKDWKRELTPGTMLCNRKANKFAVVVRTTVTSYPGPWLQLNLTLLYGPQLVTIDVSDKDFYDPWVKVKTRS